MILSRMGVKLVFNDCSVVPLAEDIFAATERMRLMALAVRWAFRIGADRALRVRRSFFSEKLTGDISINGWLKSAEFDEVLREFVRDMAASVAYFSDETVIPKDCEAHEDDVCLVSALFMDALSVSFQSNGRFLSPVLDCFYNRLDEEGRIVAVKCRVRNISDASHLGNHAEFIKSKIQFRNDGESVASLIRNFVYLLGGGGDAGVGFAFCDQFVESAFRNGFVSSDGVKGLLLETCARILIGAPKYDLKEWYGPVRDGFSSFRTHLSKAGPGYRLMFWRRGDGVIVFANVGPKFEEWISDGISDKLEVFYC